MAINKKLWFLFVVAFLFNVRARVQIIEINEKINDSIIIIFLLISGNIELFVYTFVSFLPPAEWCIKGKKFVNQINICRNFLESIVGVSVTFQ